MRQRKKQKTMNAGKYLMTILLLFCLVLTVPGISVLAETAESVSDNSTEIIDMKEAENATGTESGDTVSINEIPSNPIHHCTGRDDGSDKTTWSYIKFGTYPKSMVTDAGLKSAIDKVILEEHKRSNGRGIDVWVNGAKYRRIDRSDDCSKEIFDKVTEDMYLYFKWEPIKWKVLQSEEEKLFVLADQAIDSESYDKTYANITWKDCTLRSWLNDYFYNEAFNEEERQAIVPQDVVNNSDGGGITTDKIYLLSIDEVKNDTYGFCPYGNVYSDTRCIKSSAYARVCGAYGLGGSVNGWCWLRSQGHNSGYAAFLDYRGFVDTYGRSISYDYGIVPAMHIDLSSDDWSITDGGGDDDGDNTDDGNKGNGGEDNKDGGNSTDPSKIKVSSISLGGISKKIAAGKKISLSAEVMPKNAGNKAVTWTSSNPKYATVDANGVATMKKAGAGKSVTITATANDGSGVYAEYKIKIMKHAVKKVKITAPSENVKAGGKLKLKASVTTTGKKCNKKLKWTSSNESYATVSSSGVVKASKAGKGKTVTITAMATDGSGKKAKVKIKIK